MDILHDGALVDAGGLSFGHAEANHSGVSVALFDNGATAGVSVQGSAPGTRETDLLAPTASIQKVNALVLSGGSAFGLASADGVMQVLAEKNMGHDTGFGVVPIVPAAVIFDLPVSGHHPPGPGLGRTATQNASSGDRSRGNIGAGAGATVGKYLGTGVMKSGLGQAAVRQGDVVVSAAVVVNALGDIYDGHEKIAGAFDENGFVETTRFLDSTSSITNTTIGIVATNAGLSKTQATKVAASSHDGFARAINPVHTSDDGDLMFAVSTGTAQCDLRSVCFLAAEATRLAILDAVRSATSLGPLRGLAS